jgi:hypothetical protein
MERFRHAVESGDIDGAIGMLAADVVFQSPVVFKPYVGRDAVGMLLRVVATVFEDFHYVSELHGGAAGGAGAEGGETALVFRARVGGKTLEGVDWLRVGGDGLVTHLTVFVRPMSGLMALAEAMRARLGGA